MAKHAENAVDKAVKDIDQQLTAAIRRFGTYSYNDKGAKEIMELDPIIKSFKDSKDPLYVLAVLAKLDRKKRNEVLVQDLVCSLDDWENPYGQQFFGSGHSVITKYY